MVSLNYTFPRTLLPAWASPVSPSQWSPVSPKLPTPVPGNRHDLGLLESQGRCFQGRLSGCADRASGASGFIHSSVSLHSGGVAQGSPDPPNSVYDVIICDTPTPCSGPHPSDSCHLHPMARPPHGRDLKQPSWVYGEAGLGWSELCLLPLPLSW